MGVTHRWVRKLLKRTKRRKSGSGKRRTALWTSHAQPERALAASLCSTSVRIATIHPVRLGYASACQAAAQFTFTPNTDRIVAISKAAANEYNRAQ